MKITITVAVPVIRGGDTIQEVLETREFCDVDDYVVREGHLHILRDTLRRPPHLNRDLTVFAPGRWRDVQIEEEDKGRAESRGDPGKPLQYDRDAVTPGRIDEDGIEIPNGMSREEWSKKKEGRRNIRGAE